MDFGLRLGFWQLLSYENIFLTSDSLPVPCDPALDCVVSRSWFRDGVSVRWGQILLLGLGLDVGQVVPLVSTAAAHKHSEISWKSISFEIVYIINLELEINFIHTYKLVWIGKTIFKTKLGSNYQKVHLYKINLLCFFTVFGNCFERWIIFKKHQQTISINSLKYLTFKSFIINHQL